MNNDPYMRHEPVLKKVKWITLIFAAVCTVLGIALILFPDIMQEVMGIIIGIGLLVYGARSLYIFFKRQRDATILATDLFIGVVCLIIGLIFIIRRAGIMNYVMIIYGMILLAGGIIKLQNAIDLYHIGLFRWWIVLILGCASMVLSMLLILRPEFISASIIIFSGLFLIYDGISAFVSVLIFELALRNLKKGIPIGKPEKKPPVPPAPGPGFMQDEMNRPPMPPRTGDPFAPNPGRDSVDFGGTVQQKTDRPQEVHMNFDPETGEPLHGNTTPKES